MTVKATVEYMKLNSATYLILKILKSCTADCNNVRVICKSKTLKLFKRK